MGCWVDEEVSPQWYMCVCICIECMYGGEKETVCVCLGQRDLTGCKEGFIKEFIKSIVNKYSRS